MGSWGARYSRTKSGSDKSLLVVLQNEMGLRTEVDRMTGRGGEA